MSSVPVAKANLKTLMEAWPWPASAPIVRWGEPTKAEDLTGDNLEFLFFGETTVTYTKRGARGTNDGETYPLRVVIDVREYGDDEQATEERAWALSDELKALLNENRTLGGVISHWSDFTARQVNVPATETWRTQIVVDVSVQAFPAAT
jgi:hypothetical protein